MQDLETGYQLALTHNKSCQKIDGRGWDDTRDLAFKNAQKVVTANENGVTGIVQIFGVGVGAFNKFKK